MPRINSHNSIDNPDPRQQSTQSATISDAAKLASSSYSSPSNKMAPSISLPKGGGAIRGIGEKFATNPVTGIGSMTVPIATSPGRSGFKPQLSLSYDSGSGNGAFGFGWSLSLSQITRKTDESLPKYLGSEESDVFILSGTEYLVPEFEKDTSGNWIIENDRKRFTINNAQSMTLLRIINSINEIKFVTFSLLKIISY